MAKVSKSARSVAPRSAALPAKFTTSRPLVIRGLLLLITVLSLGALSACGNKGDLFLETERDDIKQQVEAVDRTLNELGAPNVGPESEVRDGVSALDIPTTDQQDDEVDDEEEREESR